MKRSAHGVARNLILPSHHHHHHLMTQSSSCLLQTITTPSSSPSSFLCPSPTASLFSLLRRPTFDPPPGSAALTTMTTQPSDMEKRILRAKVKKDLKSMDPTIRSQQDKAIQSIALEAPWFKSSKALCAYISCNALREVDTSNLLSNILHNTTSQDGTSHLGKKLYVPRVDDNNRHMRMLNISSLDDLIPNSMRILEPLPIDANGIQREDVMLANDPVDLFILPGLAFDKSGRRLGRGGGYYDTLLMNYHKLVKERKWKQPLLVALSYSVQILDDEVIPVTPNDFPIDAIVSPSGMILISPAALERCR